MDKTVNEQTFIRSTIIVTMKKKIRNAVRNLQQLILVTHKMLIKSEEEKQQIIQGPELCWPHLMSPSRFMLS